MGLPTLRIYLERTRIVIEGYDLPRKGTKGWLPNMFCVWSSRDKRFIDDKRYSHIEKDTGNIIMPRTADVDRIINRILASGFEIEDVIDRTNENVIAPRKFSSNISLKDGVSARDEYQDISVNFLTAPVRNNIHFRLLTLPTGKGKTFCAIAATIRYGIKTLVVADSLVDQWAEEFLSKTDISYKRIYEIKDSIDTVKKLLSNEVNPAKYDVYIASLKTLINAQKQGLYEPMCRKLGIGLKITDEIHRATYSQVFLDMCAPIAETIYLSATAFRNSDNEDYVYRMVMRHLPSYGAEVRETMHKYLHVIYIMYNTNPDFRATASCTTYYGFNLMKYAEHIFSPKNREIIYDILKYVIDTTIKHVDDDEKIVVILERLEDVVMTIDVMQRLYPDIPIGNYTTLVKKDEKRNNLRNKIIITTDKSFGTGSDLKGKLRVLVNTTTYVSKIRANQLPGRMREIPGKAVYYIDLVNKGFKKTREHYEARAKTISQYAATISKREYGVDI